MNVGDRIRVRKGAHTYEGTLMPSEGAANAPYVNLKLDNGYNVGFEKSTVDVTIIEEGSSFDAVMPSRELPRKDGLPDVAILGTGGTVASKIDYMTGAVYPSFSPEELLQLVPELGDIANIYGKELYSIVSEDITQKDWANIARSIVSYFDEGYKGVVITHGTDTLHFTSSMLSFMLRNIPHPVVCVGAQRSSDRPSSDAAFNLVSSVNFAGTDCKEVVVCMHAGIDDDYCYVHRGTRVRKSHTSRRDAFAPVNALPLAKVYGAGNIESISSYNTVQEGDAYADTKTEEKVALVKTYPGASDIVAGFVDKGYRGIILEGSGLSHAPESLHPEIARGLEEGVTFGMASQCINGRVNMNVYRGGRQLKERGVIPLEDMLAETAWCKLCWVLGHYDDAGEIAAAMLTPLAGEMGCTSRMDTYSLGRW